ncbi:hypothetical protein CHLRE_07g325980v5 [Chlamydomonas reinhardtii]|uniref:Uncharacterized protein n=1 Tax=Chlamydomonas reinhardtii TaxID=3055 RepID=A0A2K3DJI8_CHLRE|nr:uncharacterized protein CHLRE_07g325980v5 [Chlamydomonas reinhardtii]PNW80692.1 hypothetical protein CHLRE_07g325980v5 [Chlamydomonas reinhardtii]
MGTPPAPLPADFCPAVRPPSIHPPPRVPSPSQSCVHWEGNGLTFTHAARVAPRLATPHAPRPTLTYSRSRTLYSERPSAVAL